MTATWAAVRARRLERQSLAVRATADHLVDVVGRTCGIHAQVMGAAELSVAVRVEGIVRQDVHDALWHHRSLVKAWTLRGTLHLHPAHELPLWFAARRAVAPPGGLPGWRDPAGSVHPPLAASEVEAARRAVWHALDGACLSREELVEVVGPRVPRPVRQRMRSGFAFFLGDVCQGPPRGTNVTFVRPDQWLENWAEVDQREALRFACERYIGAFGPVQPSNFRSWFGGGDRFRAADACALFASLGDSLTEVDVEGRSGWVLAGDTEFPRPRRTVRLLPEYDAYIMGFRERDELVPDAVREQVARAGNGRYEGPAGARFLLVDGVTAGLWRRSRAAKRLDVRVEPARSLTPSERSKLEDEAHRLGDFLALQTEFLLIDAGRSSGTRSHSRSRRTG